MTWAFVSVNCSCAEGRHIGETDALLFFISNIQGRSFNWPSPISVPKRKFPSSQSGPFLVTGFTERAAGIGNFLFGTEIREGQLKEPPCISQVKSQKRDLVALPSSFRMAMSLSSFSGFQPLWIFMEVTLNVSSSVSPSLLSKINKLVKKCKLISVQSETGTDQPTYRC